MVAYSHAEERELSLQWRHNERGGVSNHQPHDCLLNGLFGRRSKKTSKLRVTGLCAGNSPVTGEFPAQRASNAENVFIWWRHHAWCLSSLAAQDWGCHKAVIIWQPAMSPEWATRGCATNTMNHCFFPAYIIIDNTKCDLTIYVTF